MTQDELKKWVSDNKVLFVTNSTLRPGGAFLASLKCYVDYIPMHNLAVIPGTKTTVMKEGRQVELPRYGVDVFDEMTYRIIKDPVVLRNDLIGSSASYESITWLVILCYFKIFYCQSFIVWIHTSPEIPCIPQLLPLNALASKK